MKIRKLTIAFTLGLGLTLALVWLLGGGLPVARAASFTVDVTHDENDGSCSDGDCSLRDAIIEANGNGEADSITLGAGSHVLTLIGTGENGSATGDLDITGPLTITGLGPSQTIIDASGVISDRVLDIRSGAGTVVISGVTIMNGNITGLGGGIYNYDAGLTLVNVIVSSNVATGTWPNGHGGGVYVYQGSVTLQDGQIVSNTAVEYGGGLFVNRDTAAFTQTGDSIIAHNVVTGSHSSAGGGVYIWDGSVSLNGGQVFANTAGSRGGGVRVGDAGASATLSGTLILSNTAGDGGGGVYVGAGSVKLSGGQVLSNTAGDGGGGVYVYDGSATLSGQIFNNTADVGGGVYVYDGSVTLSGGQIVSNSATWNGGGVYLSAGAAAFTQTGVSTITHNHADYGGGVYMLNGNATLSSGQILSNSATWNGGGVYVNNGSVTLSGGQIVSNTAGNAGGGVYVANSSAAFTQTGSSASYTFNTAGIYDVKLKVDPTVPDVAPNAYLFNDPAGGLSYDICRVAVGQSSNPVDSSDAATVQFQNVTVTATASQITADFTTNTPLQALFSWRMAPPDFVGPMPTGLEGYVTDQNATTNHHLSVSVDQGTPYTLSISVQPGGSGTKVYARYDNQQLWNIMTPTSGTGSVALSSSTAPVSFSVPTFAGTPGQAHITWASDVATTTRVQWSDQLSSPPSSAAAAGNYYDPTYTTDHDVTITGLTPGQTYTFYLSGVPQASTGHVYLRHPYAPGSSLAPIGWRFTVPQYYDSGSRAGEAHPLEYLTATSQEGGALQVQAVLQQPGRIRLNYRPYGTGDWTTGTWTDASGTQQWSLALSQGPYELVVDWETLGGQIMSSRPYAVVHQEVEEPQPVGLISVTVVRADNRQRLQGIGVCVDTWSNPDFVGETDANGNIIFHDIAVGEHTVFASEAGYHSANQTVTVQEDHGHIVELWLGMKSTVYGSIKLAAEHRNARPQLPRKPVDGGDGFYYADQINVSATPGGPTVQSHREEAAGSFEAGMKQHGFYLFEDLAPGAHTINISLAGWTTQPYTVNITQPGQKIRHDFVIQPAQEQQGQGQQVAVQASAYSPYRCSRIVGWDWLRSNGAAITFAFSGAEFRGCDPAGIRLEVEALCTDKASGGAGYSADLTFHLSAGSQSHVCKVEMKNPFGPPDPNLRTGKGYTINGKSGTIPAALINQAIATGQLTAAITWPSDVSPQNRHVAFKQSSLTLKSQ